MSETDTTLGGVRTSPSIGQLAAALARAQLGIENASKDKTNPAFRSRYADLASIQEACRDALATNDIAVVQSPGDGDGGRVTLTSMLIHKSGEYIVGVVSAPVSKNDAQAVGSAITYLRRYALAAMVGVAPEDDDGNGATGRRPPERQTDPMPAPRQEPKPRPSEPAPKGEHNPSWDGARAAFCAALNSEFGTTYDEVAAWLTATGSPRPSAMTHTERVSLYQYMKSEKGLADLGDFLGRRVTHNAGQSAKAK